MRTSSILATTALVIAALIVQTSIAQADDATPYACPEMGAYYLVSNSQSLHISTGVDWKSGPGGTVTRSIEYGHLQFGNWGWKMKVCKYVISSTCATTSDVTGTVNRMPSASTWGFRYWETSS